LKKLLCLTVVLILALLIPSSVVMADSPEVYNLPKQYSGTQGTNQWYYYLAQQTNPTNRIPAAWDNQVQPWGTIDRTDWNGGIGLTGSRFLEISGRDLSDWRNIGAGGASGWLQPGEYGYNNIAIGWQAPRAGTVCISGMLNTTSPVADADPNATWKDDGVLFSIYKGDILPANKLAGDPSLIFRGNNEGNRKDSVTLASTVDVTNGEMIYFYVNRNAWQNADGMFYSFTISYDPTADLTAPESGYNFSMNQLSLSATDTGGSGLARIEYAQYDPSGTEWTKYEAPITLAPGTYKFMYRALDNNGNVEPYHRVTVTATAPVSATIDINPNTLNVKSQSDKNAITTYIEFPAGYDVGQIDVATIKMDVNGTMVAAQLTPTSIGDYDTDGVLDRMVKFDRQVLIKALAGSTGDVTLTVKGQLTNGGWFTGTDTIRVINPGK
jgi:hypothetical protein